MNHFYILIFIYASVSGCAIKPNGKLFQETEEVIVSYAAPKALEENETWVGWIYLDYGGATGAEAVVYVRDNLKTATWELAEQSTSGYFGESIANGSIGANGELVGFPRSGFSKTKRIWVAGGLKAVVNGNSISTLR